MGVYSVRIDFHQARRYTHFLTSALMETAHIFAHPGINGECGNGTMSVVCVPGGTRRGFFIQYKMKMEARP